MKKEMEFPTEEEMKRHDEVREMSDKYVAAFIEQYYPGMSMEDSVDLELGELCNHLHNAFRAGSYV